MKKFITLTFILFSIFSFSQTQRFIYEFNYKSDSLNDKFKTENMVLDISNNNVQFYEFRAIRIDSVNQNINGFSNYTFPFAKLKRKTGSKINNNYYVLANDYFVFETNDDIHWKISPDIKLKNDWKLQKATASFGGRNWIAWFNSEIPFSEGPYKFNGLPGLIVELYDTKNNFNYQLIKVEKIVKANQNIVETVFKKSPLLITQRKYDELLIANYNDPYSRFRSMKPGTWSIGRSDDTYVETIEGLAKITKEDQGEIRKNYNPIEIDKAVEYKP